MIAFFCATPVQIYQVVNIKEKYYSDKRSVLYILDYFSDANKFVERIREQGIFDEVVFVKAWRMHQRIRGRKYKSTPFLKNIREYFFVTLDEENILKKLYRLFWQFYYYILKNNVLKLLQLSKNDVIEEVFFSYNEPIKVMLALKLKEKFTFSSFEDGTVDYVSGVVIEKTRVEKFFNVPDYAFIPERVYAHFPKALKNIESLSAEIIQVDYSQNKRAKESLYKIFDIENVYEIKEKVIFFDTLVANQNMDVMMKPLSVFSKEEIVYKKHPRRPDKYYEERNLNVYKGASLPFEMYCEYFDVSDKILISHCSTACISPALFFNQSPEVVWCYNFATTKNKEEYYSFDSLIERLLENNVPLKIMTPKTKEEYTDIISNIKKL